MVFHPYKLIHTVENYGDLVNKRQGQLSFINGNIVSKINILYYNTIKYPYIKKLFRNIGKLALIYNRCGKYICFT